MDSGRSFHPANRIPEGGGPLSRGPGGTHSPDTPPDDWPLPHTTPYLYPPPTPLPFCSHKTIISCGVTSESVSLFSRFFMGGGCPSPTRRGTLQSPAPGPDTHPYPAPEEIIRGVGALWTCDPCQNFLVTYSIGLEIFLAARPDQLTRPIRATIEAGISKI